MARRTIETEVAAACREGAGVDIDFSGYRDDPVRFCSEVLGVSLIPEQAAIMAAVGRTNRVTVRSGRRIGKSMLIGCIALWFICTRKSRAKCVITATKLSQVQEIAWGELTWIYKGAKKPLGGKLAHLAATGLRFEDGRSVFGVTASSAEAFQGLAAPELLFIADEASGIAEYIFTALQGNLASAGSKLVMMGNPTQTSGYFYESHREGSETFGKGQFHLPSTCSPNLIQGHVVPGYEGLADLAWLEERKRDWGADHPNYQIHVLGNFVQGLEGCLFPPMVVEKSNMAYPEAVAHGPLVIGVDPAGEGGDGDESAFACRRGQKVVWTHTRRGLTSEGHLVEVLGLISNHKGDSWEPPRVVLDRDGVVGARCWSTFQGYLETHKDAFLLVGIRGSEPSRRLKLNCNHMRDELWMNLLEAFRDGLAIPPNVKLQGDLASIRFDKLINGKTTIIQKRVIRRELGRSPDSADALALACFDSPSWEWKDLEAGDPEPAKVERPGLVMGAASMGSPYELLDQIMGSGRRRRD
jgi:phage terminase large subunit